ncbi:MAG TPA: hypothetical protein VJZ00_20810 [Thermoanaerobaculia bacterium]|nr:hypothetical protein [Thermoanaerobaculia bacterium]
MAFYRRVILIDSNGDSDVLYDDRGRKGCGRRGRRRKKVSRGLRGVERAQYRMLKGADTFTSSLLCRYRRSRRKRRDAWMTDGPRNFMRASRKAMRRMRF